jgi:hypothetical protein
MANLYLYFYRNPIHHGNQGDSEVISVLMRI